MFFSTNLWARDGDSPYLKAFKEALEKPAISFNLEFIEGDINGNESQISVQKATTPDGRSGHIIKQSQRYFFAAGQTNGFILVQKPVRVAVDTIVSNLNLSSGFGRIANQGWFRNDFNFIHLQDINSPGATTNGIAAKIKIAEDKVWSIYHYGLPKLKPNTITWEGNILHAETENGTIVAKIDLNENGTLLKATYHCLHENIEEAGEVLFSNSREREKAMLPDIISKRVLSGGDPYLAALNSFKVKVVKSESFAALFKANVFSAPISKTLYINSNNNFMVHVGTNFLSKEALATIKAPSSKRASRIGMGLFLLINFFLILFIIKHLIGKNR